MSNKCKICNKVKGKRGCKIYDDQLICPCCCGEYRGRQCEGCRYYQEGTRYQAARKESVSFKEFTVELNEEIDDAVDRAMQAVERRNFSNAEKILDGLIREHPKHHMVLYGMGVFFAMQEGYDKAIEYFKNAVEEFPIFIEAHYNLAIAYKSIFDIANMVRASRKVVELAQPGSEYYDNAQDLIGMMEQSMRKDGGVGLEAFISGQDEFDRAFILMEKGDWKGAIKGFERAIRWNSGLPQPYSNMGICYAKMGKKQSALMAFEKALEIDPNYEPAMINKTATEQLTDSQCLSGDVKDIRYYGKCRKNR